jgi:hypothetical protein
MTKTALSVKGRIEGEQQHDLDASHSDHADHDPKEGHNNMNNIDTKIANTIAALEATVTDVPGASVEHLRFGTAYAVRISDSPNEGQPIQRRIAARVRRTVPHSHVRANGRQLLVTVTGR